MILFNHMCLVMQNSVLNHFYIYNFNLGWYLGNHSWEHPFYPSLLALYFTGTIFRKRHLGCKAYRMGWSLLLIELLPFPAKPF